MNDSISPPEVPQTFLIPVDALYGGLKFLFGGVADVEKNPQDAGAFAEVFLQSAIYLVQKAFAYQHVDGNVLAILQMYRIPLIGYMNLIHSIAITLATPSDQIEQAITALRYHFVVDINYQLTSNHTLQVTLLTTVPSRDYVKVLREEIIKARKNNEFVPYKYLILAGLA